MLVFGSDEGDGRFDDWYRNARMANALDSELVAKLAKLAPIESLRENPRRKFRRYLEREETFLKTGIDEAWYVNNITDARWLDEPALRKTWRTAMRWTRPIWWAIALLVGVAAIFRRDVLFDIRAIPLVVIAMFMAAMGMLGEAQSRYAMFFVFLWPIYAGSPYLCNPLPSLRDKLGPRQRIGEGLARVAVSTVAVIAIPVILLSLTKCGAGSGLVNLHQVEVTVGKTASSTARPGAPPWWKGIRNHFVVADAPIGSEQITVTMTTSGHAPQDGSTLRFVIYNELGKPLDGWVSEVPGTTALVPGRALRVSVDGALHRTIDLSQAAMPAAFAIPGFPEGEHAIRLELDLGEAHARPQKECSHRWTPPDALARRPTPNCFNTSIGYLGFY
jgi:hypothetical protein